MTKFHDAQQNYGNSLAALAMGKIGAAELVRQAQFALTQEAIGQEDWSDEALTVVGEITEHVKALVVNADNCAAETLRRDNLRALLQDALAAPATRDCRKVREGIMAADEILARKLATFVASRQRIADAFDTDKVEMMAQILEECRAKINSEKVDSEDSRSLAANELENMTSMMSDFRKQPQSKEITECLLALVEITHELSRQIETYDIKSSS